jgi:pimeloyl-ACP methyl ester carboxylesterase
MMKSFHLFLFVSVSSLLVACATAPPRAHVPPPPPVSEHRVGVDGGVEIVYSVIGDRGPVVLVPLGRVMGSLEPLASAGFRVVMIDPRGRGMSSPATEEVSLSIDADIADLEAVRQAIGEPRVSLIGMSYYGALVALYAAQHPERVDRIVMIAPMAPTTALFADQSAPDNSAHPDYVELDRMRRESVHESDPVAFCRQYYKAHALELYADPARFSPDSLPYCELENEWPDNFLRWAGRLFSSIAPWDFRERAAAITAPALVIQGRQDRITPPRGAAAWTEAMRNRAKLVWIDDCGHVVMKEQPEEAIALITEFLAR